MYSARCRFRLVEPATPQHRGRMRFLDIHASVVSQVSSEKREYFSLLTPCCDCVRLSEGIYVDPRAFHRASRQPSSATTTVRAYFTSTPIELFRIVVKPSASTQLIAWARCLQSGRQQLINIMSRN